MTLTNIYFTLCKQGYCSDKGSVHSYIDVYERVLEPYRHGSCLEIGLFHGHSLRMWEKYFDGEVHGIDCSLTPHDMADLRQMIATGEHNIHIFDAEDRTLVNERFGGMKFDVIIDDAGHHLPQQLKLYSIFKEYINLGGVYIIEDIQDIEASRNVFENLDNEKDIDIVDLRTVKGRYDDLMVIIRDKK